MPLILGTNSIKDTGYNVANSLRFNQGSSDYLNRTNGSSTGKIWSFSCWFKISDPSDTNMNIFNVSSDANNTTYVEVATKSQNGLDIQVRNGSGTTYIRRRSSAVLRDVTSWYNAIVIFDSTNSTADDRIKVFLNGSRLTSFQENVGTVDADYVTQIGVSNAAVEIGRNTSAAHHFDGYLAEIVLVDGTALSTTDFGEFDEDSPTIWKPKDVSGLTFGTNGFHLDFENASSLGADVSGNSNNFTVNNLTSVDQSTDTCTNNFATFNGVLGYNSTIVLAEGNLKGTTGSTHQALYGSIFSSIGVTQGAWYAEFKVTTNSNHSIVGISADLESDANGSSGGAYNFIYLGQGIGYYGSNGKIFHTSSDFQMTYGSAVSNNDIVGVALDVDNQEVYFSINGVFQNSGNPESGASKTGGVVNEGARNIFSTGTGTLFFAVADFDATATCAIEANFGGGSVSAISSGNSDANGHGNFSYAVPSGYFSLCTKNLAEFG